MRVNLLCTGLMFITFWTIVECNNHKFHQKNKGFKRLPRQRRNKSDKPNIVVVLTDDQDVLLGSLKAMPKTTKLLKNQGVSFNNSFTTTPMCCPSRSSILTGMYVHNHNVFTNNENCSSIRWQQTHETRSFATYLSDKGYRTGYFGKYLNEYNGTYIPPGWKEWVGLIRNSRYYNYSINFNGQKIKHGDNYYTDYLTDLIANDSVTFLKQSKQYYPARPVLMVLSVPAPHGPEDAAPQYQHMFKNNTDHRTPSWNYAPNPDKQWLLQHTEMMTPLHRHFTDMLHRKRLQTLQSVDDLVEKVYNELDMLGELENTYIVYMSDHGYHLGQYGLVKGKATPYDFDIRIPMIIRGPGIEAKSTISNIVANIDIAPTILDMADIQIPDHMDGRSMLKLIKAHKDTPLEGSGGFVRMRKPVRDTILIERGKVTRKQLQSRLRQEKSYWDTSVAKGNAKFEFFMNKRLRKLSECSKPEYQAPCKQDQKWYCMKQANGNMRRQRCKTLNSTQNDQSMPCNCAAGRRKARKERKNQRRFIRNHVNNKDFRGKFLRIKRSLSAFYQMNGSPTVDLDSQIGIDLFDRRCRTLPNNTISCDRELYENPDAWQNHKQRIEDMIKEYRKALEDLRGIRRHLKDKRPNDLSLFDDDLNHLYSTSIGKEIQEVDRNEEEDCDCEDDLIPSNKPLGRSDLKEQRMRRRNMKKKRHRRKNRNPDCNSPNMKCFTHDNNHWQTPPRWTPRRKGKFNHQWCKQPGMECALMDNHHWKTAPFWKLGPFCFCPNANNNTYWCLRTINQTHDFLYCEFITSFFSYYNFIDDPDQLKNSVHKLNFGVRQQLHEQLAHMKACNGRSCTVRPGLGGIEGRPRESVTLKDIHIPKPKSDPPRQRERSSAKKNLGLLQPASISPRDEFIDV